MNNMRELVSGAATAFLLALAPTIDAQTILHLTPTADTQVG